MPAPVIDTVEQTGVAAEAVLAPGRLVWTKLVVGTVCQTTMLVILSLALWAAMPAALGWIPTTVSSGSMLPRLRVGDIAVARPLQAPPKLNQVLLFDDPDHSARLRLHRFVRVDEQGLMVTRGDANRSDDSTPISTEAVHGVAVLRVPFIGSPIVWLRESRWVPLVLTTLGLLVLGFAAGSLSRIRGEDPPEDERTGPDSEKPPGVPDLGSSQRDSAPVSRASRQQWRWAPSLGVVVVVAGVIAGAAPTATPAWASFSTAAVNPTSTFAGASYYTCRAAVLAEAPTLYYALNETSGTTATDSSGNGRTANYVGGTTKGVAKGCTRDTGTAVTLDGSTGYLSAQSAQTAPNTFTEQAWFKTSTARGGRIIGFGTSATGASSNSDRHVYMTDAGKLVFGVSPPGSKKTIVSPSSYNDGAWHRVTATLSSAGMRLYVDGAMVASDPTATTGQAMNGYVRIGYDSLTGWTSRPTSLFFAGTVDEVALYPTALSATAVAADYEAGR